MIHAPIDLYVFSGTGNTLLVARAMCGVFLQHGIEASLLRMERCDPRDVDVSHTLGLAFPVAAQATYPLVWDFIRHLPDGDGARVFMVDTMCAYSGGIVGPLYTLLGRKGYHPVGAREITMPLNIMRRRIDASADSAKVARGVASARQYAEEIIRGAAHWGRVPILPDIMRIVAAGAPTWHLAHWLGRRMRVDPERCTQCELCVRLCPTGNIGFDRYPVFGSRCLQCMRCVSFCPTNALSVPGLGASIPYRAVDAQTMLGDDDAETLRDA